MPSDITVSLNGDQVVAKGPKGELTVAVPKGMKVVLEGSSLTVSRKSDDKPSRALHGFLRATIANAIVGVAKGWSKSLELSGVGYRATMSGDDLVLAVGFSHTVTIKPAPGITLAVMEGKIVVSGADKQTVGQMAASIREVKKPEPYKGKGIKYEGERIRKKAGKAAKAVGAGAPGAK